MLLASQSAMPPTVLTADFKCLDAIAHLGKVGYVHRSRATIPFTHQGIVLERADELLMRRFLITRNHAILLEINALYQGLQSEAYRRDVCLSNSVTCPLALGKHFKPERQFSWAPLAALNNERRSAGEITAHPLTCRRLQTMRDRDQTVFGKHARHAAAARRPLRVS
jgi:hypothetical protein